MSVLRRGSILLAVLACVAGLAPAGAAGASRPGNRRPTTTIALVGDEAINPLHAEFRTADGGNPVYPPGMPKPVQVALPKTTDFNRALDVLARGPLGHPKPGTLYAIRGTRLLIYATPETDFLMRDRAHGTGVASSAAGSDTGTSPDSLIVFVPGYRDASYDWLAEQDWIDVASTSLYAVPTTEQCAGDAGAKALYDNGGLLFSSSGNTQDYYEPFSSPNGRPEVFQVGGVDGSGKTWLPGHPEEPQPTFAFGNVVRPYEVGARFSFPAASGDSIDGKQPFGGTSGATPTVAGYAAELIAEARTLLGDRGAGTKDVLAVARPGRPTPKTGPLADGRFTRDELVDILHHAASPHEPASPVRYAVEGYGAWSDGSLKLATEVLRGDAKLPARPDEDVAHAQAEEIRAAQASRCS